MEANIKAEQFSRYRGENFGLNSGMEVCIEKRMDLNLTFPMEPGRLANRFIMKDKKWQKLRMTPRFWIQITSIYL